MLAMLVGLGVATGDVLQEHRPPPPPVIEDSFNPEVRIVATSYFCNGREGRYTMRFSGQEFQEVVSATRDGVWVHPVSLRTINETLRRLPGVSLRPQCFTANDWIEVTIPAQPQILNGMIRWTGQPWITVGGIRWSGEHMVFIPNDPPAPGRE
jgi:hypothetical protein